MNITTMNTMLGSRFLACSLTSARLRPASVKLMAMKAMKAMKAKTAMKAMKAKEDANEEEERMIPRTFAWPPMKAMKAMKAKTAMKEDQKAATDGNAMRAMKAIKAMKTMTAEQATKIMVPIHVRKGDFNVCAECHRRMEENHSECAECGLWMHQDCARDCRECEGNFCGGHIRDHECAGIWVEEAVKEEHKDEEPKT